MSKASLKKRILIYLDQVDKSLLKIIHQLLEREVELQKFELTKKEWKEVEHRAREMKSGKVKGIPHEEMTKNLRAQLKNRKKKS